MILFYATTTSHSLNKELNECDAKNRLVSYHYCKREDVKKMNEYIAKGRRPKEEKGESK